jgi:hypothetical protein
VFNLVYLLRNTITNLTTQDEQVRTFRNAAAHLTVGGLFVVENYVPELRRLAPGETTHVFTATPTHLAFEEYTSHNSSRFPTITGSLTATSSISHHHTAICGLPNWT